MLLAVSPSLPIVLEPPQNLRENCERPGWEATLKSIRFFLQRYTEHFSNLLPAGCLVRVVSKCAYLVDELGYHVQLAMYWFLNP